MKIKIVREEPPISQLEPGSVVLIANDCYLVMSDLGLRMTGTVINRDSIPLMKLFRSSDSFSKVPPFVLDAISRDYTAYTLVGKLEISV